METCIVGIRSIWYIGVLILPMRNGNRSVPILLLVEASVLILPMRNGN